MPDDFSASYMVDNGARDKLRQAIYDVFRLETDVVIAVRGDAQAMMEKEKQEREKEEKMAMERAAHLREQEAEKAAAKEISGLIANSANEVKDGVRLVGETGESLKSIEGFVLEIDTNVEAIATAATEQSISLAEINLAVSALDQMAQENAGMVSGMSAVAEALSGGAGELEQLVKRFKLNRRKWTREPGSEAEKRGPEHRGYGKNSIYLPTTSGSTSNSAAGISAAA